MEDYSGSHFSFEVKEKEGRVVVDEKIVIHCNNSEILSKVIAFLKLLQEADFDEYENLEHCLEDCFPIVSFEILETFIEILETLKDRNISPSLQDPTTLNEFFKDLKGFIKSHPIYNEMFWTFHCDEPCDYESSDDESSDIDKNA